MQTDRRRIVPGLNTLFSKASRHSAEALPLRGSAVQDARHVAISASDDGGAYRRSSGLICSANTRLDGSWTIQLAQGGAGRVHGDVARSRLGPDVAAALGHDPPPHPFHPSPVHPEIEHPDAGSRSDMDDALGREEVELEVVP